MEACRRRSRPGGAASLPRKTRSTQERTLDTKRRPILDDTRPDPRMAHQSAATDPDAWVFPSAKGTTPLGRDNAWRGLLAPRLKAIQLDWATFQIMRRTYASLSRQAGIDPKLVADQLGHGLGVNLDVYTVAALDQRQHAVQALETTLIRT